VVGNPNNIAIGACTINIDGTDIGLTTESGVTFGEPVRTFRDIWDDRSLTKATQILERIVRTISFELQEVTQNALKEFHNLLSLNPVTYSLEDWVMVATITGPAASGTTFTYITNCRCIECGNVVRSKSHETVLPVTLEERGNSANQFGMYTEV